VASARFLRMHPTSANQFLKQGDAVAQERVQRACYASPSCCIPWVRTVQLYRTTGSHCICNTLLMCCGQAVNCAAQAHAEAVLKCFWSALHVDRAGH